MFHTFVYLRLGNDVLNCYIQPSYFLSWPQSGEGFFCCIFLMKSDEGCGVAISSYYFDYFFEQIILFPSIIKAMSPVACKTFSTLEMLVVLGITPVKEISGLAPR